MDSKENEMYRRSRTALHKLHRSLKTALDAVTILESALPKPRRNRRPKVPDVWHGLFKEYHAHMETVGHIKAKRWAYQRFNSDPLIRGLAKTQNAFRVALDRKYSAWRAAL